MALWDGRFSGEPAEAMVAFSQRHAMSSTPVPCHGW